MASVRIHAPTPSPDSSDSGGSIPSLRHSIEVEELRRLKTVLNTWRRFHTPLLIVTLFLSTVGVVLSFAAGVWSDVTPLTFVSGCIQVLCIALQRMDQKFLTEQSAISKQLDLALVNAGQLPLNSRRSNSVPFPEAA